MSGHATPGQKGRHAIYLGRVVIGGSKWPLRGSHRQKWRCEIQGRAAAIVRPGDGRRRRASSDVAMRARGRWPPPATWCHRRQWRCCSSTCAAWSSRHRRMRRCSSEAKKNRLGVSEAASLHAVQGGRNRAGDQGGKPRGLMCSSATLAGFFDLSDASGPPWALLDLLLLFLDVLLLLVLLLVARHCCKVSDEAAFCLIQRPYISKTLLTRRISPRGSP
uniref:hypothetical protein n=1 Tax=Klebsiella pneumoniae TaxID=573 RepID=UPI0003005573|nr:hypothetical protein [Klebsiella pneumoniae]